jgi:predicted enzyme related to lactoylglutathione lyase
MGERTGFTPGTFCFADLGARDPDAAAAFYTGLFGWSAEPVPGGGYTMFRLGGKSVAGMFQAPEDQQPFWLSYVSVEDAKRTTAEARERGAGVLVEPRAVAETDVGWAAVLRDPHGAVFALWQPGSHRGAELVNQVGTMVWNQLATPDREASKRFYGELFGWSFEPFEDASQPYENVRNREGWLNGGVMDVPADEVPPHWQVSFTVEAADAAVARVEELGGETVMPPTRTAVGNVAVVWDPQGAAFGLFDGDPEP